MKLYMRKDSIFHRCSTFTDCFTAEYKFKDGFYECTRCDVKIPSLLFLCNKWPTDMVRIYKPTLDILKNQFIEFEL